MFQLHPLEQQIMYIEDFIKHGIYLRNWTPRTVRTYRQGLATLPPTLTKASLTSWVVEQRQRGLAPGGINMYARTINSYLTWLHEEGHASERLRIRLLPNPPKPYNTFSDADLRRLATFAPKGWTQRRTWTLAMLLLDTGLRIAEALGLEREHVDLDTLALRVLGKGQRVRLVPISVEGRKALFRWMRESEDRYVFGTKQDRQWEYRNAYRDLTALCHSLGIVGVRVKGGSASSRTSNELTNSAHDSCIIVRNPKTTTCSFASTMRHGCSSFE